MADQPALTIDEPVATGWLRSEFYGDADKGKAYLYAARKQLGALKTRYGVNERVAQGEPGGFYFDSRMLPDGTQIETLTNDGHDTVRITVPTTQSFGGSTSVGEGESTSFQGQGESTDFTPPPLPGEVTTAKPVYDEPLIDYSFWIVFSKSDARSNHTIKEWDMDSGFTGREVLITAPGVTTTTAHIIFDGFVWGVGLFYGGTTDTIFRQHLQTGIRTELYTPQGLPVLGSHRGASSTATPLGVLFAIAGVNAACILLDAEGQVIYDVPMNGGLTGGRTKSFINDGEYAYLHYSDTSSNKRGMVVIHIATGANTTINLTASDFATPDDYRMATFGAFAVLAEEVMYGVRFRNSETPPIGPTEIFMRDPSANISSTVLADVSYLYPDDPDGASLLSSGAATITHNGAVIVATNRDVVTIDPATKTVAAQYSVADLWGLPFDEVVGDTPTLIKGASIIPGTDLAALFFQVDPYPGTQVLATLDAQSGETATYDFVDAFGYLVQYTITPAANPDPDQEPPREEWEYLSRTNVNPF